jgi:hypothetical protein
MALQLSTLFNGGQDSGMSGTGRRAYYAMLGRNTSSTWHGAAFFDRNVVGAMFNQGGPGDQTSYAPAYIVLNENSTYQYYNAIWGPVYSGTQEQPTTSGSSTWVNSTVAAGEFGNAMVDTYSDGTISNVYNRYSGDASVKHNLNYSAINSDHSNKRIVYILRDSVIRAVDRLYGSHHVPMNNTADFSVSSLNSNMTGSASYHSGRKELTIISYASSGGSYNCFTYQNVNFDLYPDPSVALNRPEVVRVNATLSLASSWQNNTSDAYYNLKPVTTDNGNVYVSVFWEGTSLGLYQFTRSGTSAITATYITQITTTTSYGRDQGANYGQRQITSRDGTSVATFCPYYYYGCGIRCYMIDKTNNTYTTFSQNSSATGCMTIPYGDSGWAFAMCQNMYASNHTGSFVHSKWAKSPAGGHSQESANQYWPYFTGPDTTNYPGFTQVTDYVLLTDNAYGLK